VAVKTGIEVYGKAFGMGVIDKLARDAKKAKTEVSALKQASAGLSASMSGAIAGLELAKKGLAALSMAYAATAGRAIELRAANDPARLDIEKTAKAASDAAAALGDAMIPGVQALGQALTPLIRQTTAWLTTNRAVIATGLGQWMQDAARVGARTLGVAIVGTAKAFYGVLFVVDLVKVGINAAFSSISEGSAVALRAAADMAGALGQDGLAASMRETADAAAGLGAEFDRSGADASAALMANMRELDAIEGAVTRAGAAVDSALSGVGVRAASNLTTEVHRASGAMRALAGDADGAVQVYRQLVAETAKAQLGAGARDMAKSTGAMTEQQYRYGIATAKAAETEQARVDGMRALRLEYGAAADAAVESTGSIAGASEMLAQRKSDFGEYAAAAQSMSQVIASGLADTVVAIASGTMDAGQALAKFVGDTIKNLGTLLVQLGTAALLASALSVIPVFAGLVGPPGVGAGVAAAAIAGGAVLIAAGSAIGMAEGGMVRGPGVNGTDSVLANLAPGELVVPYPEVRRNVREGRAPGDSGAPRASEGGGINVHVTQQSLVPANDAQWRRTVERSVLPIVQEAIRSGRLRLA
jgi:hypothetical protein